MSVEQKILQMEIQALEKTKKNRLMLLSKCAICGKKKYQLLLKIKNSIILIIFEMISLKWIKSLTNFYWPETNLCQNCM